MAMNSLARTIFRRQLARFFSKVEGPMKCEQKKPQMPSRLKKFKDLQKKFSADDGVPVYLKAGTRDKLLFQFCVGGLAVGFVMALDVLYTLIMPGKREELLNKQNQAKQEAEEAAAALAEEAEEAAE